MTAFPVLLLILAAGAHAGEVEDAHQGLSKGYNDFYNRYRASPDKSPEAAEKISKETIAPAEAGVNAAIHSERSRTIRRNLADPSRKRGGKRLADSAHSSSKAVDAPPPVRSEEPVVSGQAQINEVEMKKAPPKKKKLRGWPYD